MTDQPLEIKVAKLEVKEKELRADMVEIKEQVTNHIPTQIRAVKKVVDGLRDVHIAEIAVAKAWDNNLKKTLIVIGLVFTVLRVADFFVK